MVRNEISEKNKYHLPKHRYLELKHFCLQYNDLYKEMQNVSLLSPVEFQEVYSIGSHSDPTAALARYLERLGGRMFPIHEALEKTVEDQYIKECLFDAVTNGLSYEQINAQKQVPCCREVYYDLYRKFFWHLDKSRY